CGRELLHARRDHAEHRRVDPRRLRPPPGRLEVDGRPPQRERDPLVPGDYQVAVAPGQARDVLAALQRLAQRRGHVVHVGIDPLPHRTKSSTAALKTSGTSKYGACPASGTTTRRTPAMCSCSTSSSLAGTIVSSSPHTNSSGAACSSRRSSSGESASSSMRSRK